MNPLVGEVIVTGEDNGLTARIYPNRQLWEAKALDTEMIRSQLQEFLDEYNKKSADLSSYYRPGDPENPFIRSTTKKIRRQDVLIDEPSGIIKTRLREFLRRVFIMSVYMQGIQDKRGSMPDRKICVRIPCNDFLQDQNYPLSICEGHRSYCRSHR